MASILFRSDNAELIQKLTTQINLDLQQVELDTDLQLSAPITESGDITRGDPIALTTVALTAVAAGGALTVLLGKDGFLSALAKVLEKYVEGQQVEVLIESDDGSKLQVKGPVGEIKAILKQIQQD